MKYDFIIVDTCTDLTFTNYPLKENHKLSKEKKKEKKKHQKKPGTGQQCKRVYTIVLTKI